MCLVCGLFVYCCCYAQCDFNPDVFFLGCSCRLISGTIPLWSLLEGNNKTRSLVRDYFRFVNFNWRGALLWNGCQSGPQYRGCCHAGVTGCGTAGQPGNDEITGNSFK